MKAICMTDEQYGWFEEAIAEMGAIYADQERDDWWDADDIARDVAERLGDVMGKRGDDAVVTKEAYEAYRMVRRFYAEQDVRKWLSDHGVDPDGCGELELLTDKYDEWQGDNPYWYEAIGFLAEDMGLETS